MIYMTSNFWNVLYFFRYFSTTCFQYDSWGKGIASFLLFSFFSDFVKSQGIFPLTKTHGRQDLPSYLLKISFLMTTFRAPILIFEKWNHGYQTLKTVVQTTFLSKSGVSGLIKVRKNNNSEIWMNFYLLKQKQES